MTRPPTRVMIVDDHPMVAEGIEAILESYDDITVVATLSNGQAAIDRVVELAPDVVLLDWNMPVMTGIEFITQLRLRPGGDKPKVVFCTTENDVAHIREAISMGADE